MFAEWLHRRLREQGLRPQDLVERLPENLAAETLMALAGLGGFSMEWMEQAAAVLQVEVDTLRRQARLDDAVAWLQQSLQEQGLSPTALAYQMAPNHPQERQRFQQELRLYLEGLKQPFAFMLLLAANALGQNPDEVLRDLGYPPRWLLDRVSGEFEVMVETLVAYWAAPPQERVHLAVPPIETG